jgi:hypothetical protein
MFAYTSIVCNLMYVHGMHKTEYLYYSWSSESILVHIMKHQLILNPILSYFKGTSNFTLYFYNVKSMLNVYTNIYIYIYIWS